MKSTAQDIDSAQPSPSLPTRSGDENRESPFAETQLLGIPSFLDHVFSGLPDADVVFCGAESISRLQLLRRSEKLAEWLTGHGAGPGKLVGVYMERSIEMVVAVLGVLKAGAAYVPLDPNFPRARIEQILRETQVPVLLVSKRHKDELTESAEVPEMLVLCLDSDQCFPAVPATHVAPLADPQMLAYVIFTSGSTGRPKGVEITHASVVNLLTSAIHLLEAGSAERFVAITTLSFDISVLELLLPLVCGGIVVVATQEQTTDPVLLMELLVRSRATMLQATPVTFRLLLEVGFRPPAGFKMLCGGEAWSTVLAEKLLATGGRLWNMYGPTETTVWSSIVEVRSGVKRLTLEPTVAGTRFHVLDEVLHPVPRGTPGELWIAGAGVARGYFRRHDLTAERFLNDPDHPGQRMYRTGDEVRQSEHGGLEFLGRLDHQVKLRGFRIELGEVETAVQAVMGVRDAVAMLRQDDQKDDFLAVFCAADARVRAPDLRKAVENQLPAYMVPKVFVVLDSLPLTLNGKIDRLELSEWQINESLRVGNARNAPEQAFNEIEQRMATLWQKVFPGEELSVESDFFDFGGDSLVLVRLQSMIANEFGLRLTIADVTRNTTLSALSMWVAEMKGVGGISRERERFPPSLLPLQNEGREPPVFIIPQMLIFRTLAEELGREQPVYALQVMDEDLSDEMETASFTDLAALYCTLIRNAQPEGPYRLGGWCLWGWMAYEVARLLEEQGERVEMLMIIDAWAPGYWTRYSPLRQFFVNLNHFGQRVRWYADSMNTLSVSERMKDGLRRLRAFGKTLLSALPRGLRPQLEVVETMRIQQLASRAAETYRPGPISAPVLLFKSELRPTGHFIGEDMGWSAVLGREVPLHSLPGNHTEIFSLPAARMMAEEVRRALGLKPEGAQPQSSSTP